jgi:ABC-type uncharacterized transport system involved in gliding motility auxiliary subunit
MTQEKNSDQNKSTISIFISTYSGYISFILAAVGLVSFLSGSILYLLIRDIRMFSLIVIIVGIVLMLLAIAFSPKIVYTALVGRRGRYGANTLLMILAILFITGIVNFLFFDMITYRGDLTATKQFDLAPQTIQVIDDLPEPIMAHAFFVTNLPNGQVAWASIKDVLEEYKIRARSNFDYILIDPQEQPSKARNFNVQASGTIVFEGLDSGRRQSIFTSTEAPAQEQDITGALLAVTGIKQKVVYFLEGHDEHSFRDIIGDRGYGVATRGLFADNYSLQSLNLLQTEDVPSDSATLIIAGPKKDLRRSEQEALDRYLINGGAVLFLMNPDTPPRFRDLLAQWGVALGAGSIVDPASSLATDQRSPLVPTNQYLTEDINTGSLIPITSVLKSPTLFPDVTSVEPTVKLEDLPQGMLFSPLAFTTQYSWLETAKSENVFEQELDTPGPLFIGALVITNQPVREGAVPSGNLAKFVVYGDSDFASNFLYSYSSNGDLLLNSVNWLTEDFNLISIRPKAVALRQLFLTQRERDLIKWSSWLLIPAFVSLLGVVVWWRRR